MENVTFDKLKNDPKLLKSVLSLFEEMTEGNVEDALYIVEKLNTMNVEPCDLTDFIGEEDLWSCDSTIEQYLSGLECYSDSIKAQHGAPRDKNLNLHNQTEVELEIYYRFVNSMCNRSLDTESSFKDILKNFPKELNEGLNNLFCDFYEKLKNTGALDSVTFDDIYDSEKESTIESFEDEFGTSWDDLVDVFDLAQDPEKSSIFDVDTYWVNKVCLALKLNKNDSYILNDELVCSYSDFDYKTRTILSDPASDNDLIKGTFECKGEKADAIIAGGKVIYDPDRVFDVSNNEYQSIRDMFKEFKEKITSYVRTLDFTAIELNTSNDHKR